jgi:hypothetical protein
VGHRPDWNDQDFKKTVLAFADGTPGGVDIQAPIPYSEATKVTEAERQAQEASREAVPGGEKKDKRVPSSSPMAAGNFELNPDKFDAPEGYREDQRYTRKILAEVGMKDGGYVKKKGKR